MKHPCPRRSVFAPLLLALAAAGWAGAAANAAPEAPPSDPSPPKNYPLQNLVRYADPMCGTDGKAFTFPGAVAPFGMIQWSPDTEAGQRKAGYSAQDSRISGFSLTHVSGAGCSYGEDFQFMPLLGKPVVSPGKNRTALAARFSHANEVARPGYYAVKLDNGIGVELTATTHGGFGRFRFPGEGEALLAVNAASDVNGVVTSTIVVDAAQRTISGSATGGFFCHARDRSRGERTVYFYAVFDRPFTTSSTWIGDSSSLGSKGVGAGGRAVGAMVTFDAGAERTVLAKVGISYVSNANAKANLEAELPLSHFASADFDAAVRHASEDWNAWLNRIQIAGGTEDERRTFYSMLYHTLLAPSVVSDVNGQYLGYDGEVHSVAENRRHYGFFSGWDVYRTECPLLAMLAPDLASDMAQSLLVDYQQGGAFPRWGAATQDSGTMVGDPAAPMIAGFHAFGATNFDVRAALQGLLRAATDPAVASRMTKASEREALADYLSLGYVPEHAPGAAGSVSITLEYASADFALAQLAKALGDETSHDRLLRRAQNWRNHFNPTTGYLEMRRRDRTWAPGFAAGSSSYDGTKAFVEGTGGQYVWMVPFNLKGLAEAMGGPDAAAARLDQFFTELNGGFESEHAFIGNEPSLGAPWVYDFLGRPAQTQSIVRRILTELFSASPNGFPGNDDLGTLSAWYVFGALGIYPALPGADVLVLGSPLFPEATVHLAGGDLVIRGHGAEKSAPYVQRLTVNGRDWNKPWLRFGDVRDGGTLEFRLAATANERWGSAASDAPPSYGP